MTAHTNHIPKDIRNRQFEMKDIIKLWYKFNLQYMYLYVRHLMPTKSPEEHAGLVIFIAHIATSISPPEQWTV